MPAIDQQQATVRELVIQLALVQQAMRRGACPVDAAGLKHRERDIVDELRRRDLTLRCDEPVSNPRH